MESIQNRGKTSGGGTAKGTLGSQLGKVFIMLVILILGAWWVVNMALDGQFAFAILFTLVIGAGLAAFWFKGLYPHRYIFPGVAGMVIFIIFPLVYTIYISFTNYSAKNLFTLERSETYHLTKTYRVEGGDYKFDLVSRGNETYSIVLKSGGVEQPDGTVSPVVIYASDPTKMYNRDEMKNNLANETAAKKKSFYLHKVDTVIGESCGIKCKIQFRDYLKLAKVRLDNLELSMVDLNNYSAVKKKFKHVTQKVLGNGTTISGEHLLLDNESNKIFAPDMETGYYRYVNDTTGEFEGEDYTPGFRGGVGFYHFKRIVSDPNISEPFVKIFVWTVCFAAGTVFITLAIGMILACLAQWEFLRARGFYRVMLILPYAVPSFISILVFKGLFKSIPDDLYEASAMDGANPIQNFARITLPLLMKPLTPLLIASFAFNFNNFVLIMLLTNGGPDFIPEAGSTTATMAGSTDLLVSYTYRLAFEGGAGGNDYGLASAIATAIFILVGALSVINLKLSKMSAKD